MALKQNTILITGGSSGIGLEMAKVLAKGNKVLICGRSQQKLDAAAAEVVGVETFQCDLARPDECERLAAWVEKEHPACNILVNNAALVHAVSFADDREMISKATTEVAVNFLAPVILSKLLIPVLERNNNPIIVNVTTGLVYAPKAAYPIYNATKAALHSFTQVLRLQLEKSCISVVEVLFPAVDTPWHKGNPPAFAISAEQAVTEALAGIERGAGEIAVGKVKLLRGLARIAPAFAVRKINRM